MVARIGDRARLGLDGLSDSFTWQVGWLNIWPVKPRAKREFEGTNVHKRVTTKQVRAAFGVGLLNTFHWQNTSKYPSQILTIKLCDLTLYLSSP
jgi:hypothetical protein